MDDEERALAVDNATPPAGAIPLGQLIETLMACLDEAGVSEQTLVRVEPEFGRPDEALFTSGAGVTYPAGSGWASYAPFVTIEYRKGIR